MGDQGKRYVLVSERTARTVWPGQNPVGRQFILGYTPEAPFTVIGVVKDARTITLAQSDPMMVYVPYWIRCDSTSGLLVRTRQDPASLADAVRKAVWSVDAAVSVPVMRSLDGVVADSLANRRVKLVGELVQRQFRIGLLRMERNTKDRMSMSEIERFRQLSSRDTANLMSLRHYGS